MKANKTQSHSIDAVFAILLFSTLVLCSLLILVMGGRVYRSIADGMDKNFVSRTALSYISNKVKQHDITGSVFVEDRNGINTLILEEDIDGTVYETLIYYDQGSLRELFTEAGNNLDPQSGLEILEADPIRFEMVEKNLLKAVLSTNDGQSVQVYLNLRSEGQ